MVPNVELQKEFEEIQKEIAALRKAKVKEYGEDRYHERDKRVHALMLYSDIYRKYIRLKTQTFNFLLEGKPLELDALRESYLDLANYGTMGVQIIDMIKKGEDLT